jgi:glycerol uptake facilitator-like aquaporin
MEMFFTTCLVYISGLIGITVQNYQTVQVGAYVGISNVFLLALFIFAASPASGGHLNPLITFATMLVGLTQVSRGKSTRALTNS